VATSSQRLRLSDCSFVSFDAYDACALWPWPCDLSVSYCNCCCIIVSAVGWTWWDWSLIPIFLQCFDIWVIWPVKTRPRHKSRIRYLSKKKFANFNEFSEIKKFVKIRKKFVKCPSGRGLPTTIEEFDAFQGYILRMKKIRKIRILDLWSPISTIQCVWWDVKPCSIYLSCDLCLCGRVIDVCVGQ